MNVTPTIVHALRHGFPLCEFDRRVPGEWPAGHTWITWQIFDEPEANDLARCPGCIAVADAGEQPADALVEIDYHGIALDYARRCGAMGSLVVELLGRLHKAECQIESEWGESGDLKESWRDSGGEFEEYRERLAAINLKNESLGSHSARPAKGTP